MCYAGSDLHTSVGDVDTMIRAGDRDALNLLATARFTIQAGYSRVFNGKVERGRPSDRYAAWHMNFFSH